MEKIRAFIALPLPDQTKERLSRLIGELKQKIQGARFVPPEQLHVTLHFFAALSPEETVAVREVARMVAARAQKFWLSFEGIGFFPNSLRPRVMWLGISEGSEQCATLHEALGKALQARRIPCETRPFRPHLTLARFKTDCRVGKVVSEYFDYKADRFVVEAMVLFQSQLTPRGAIHTPIEVFSLLSASP